LLIYVMENLNSFGRRSFNRVWPFLIKFLLFIGVSPFHYPSQTKIPVPCSIFPNPDKQRLIWMKQDRLPLSCAS